MPLPDDLPQSGGGNLPAPPDADTAEEEDEKETGEPAAPAGPLDTLASAFALLSAGPRPLALHGARLAAGLPDRLVPLAELRVLLLHPGTSAATRNAVWAELVRRAVSGPPAWMVGLAGVALPGLYRAAARLAAASHADREDLETEILAGFLAEVRRLDPGDLAGVPLPSRLTWAAYRAGRALAYRDAAWASRRRVLADAPAPPAMLSGHPDFVLAAAVRRGVITPADAYLIGACRLEGIRMSRLSAELRIRHDSLCRRRSRAEKRLTAAIAAGDLEFPDMEFR